MPNPYTGTENDPFQEAQHRYLGPQWEQFFGSLKGKNVRFAGAAGGPSTSERMREQIAASDFRDPSQDTARTLAMSDYSDNYHRQQQGDRILASQADIAEAQARAVAGQERDQEAIDRAMQTGGQPAAPIGQNPDGSYTTMRPAGRPPPTVQEQRANVLKMLPGHLQPVYQKQWAAQDLAAAKEAETARHNQATEGSKATEPLVAIMGPNNKPILVPRSQAAGQTPASTREQGRPVTANDAGDLADFDTSKDELAAVRAAISDKDSTGIVARIGATIPYVTQITGWGEDAKKRQAVIDRVKQVIGKTLEGGVLRKEDEAKYEKILPTIGDSPAVAAAKLNGLDAALDKRKQRRLDALKDAGYETSQFEARGGKGGGIVVKAPDGSDHPFETQAQADAFKKLAGIK